MKNQRKLQVSLVILSLILFGLTSWTVYAQEPDDRHCPEADARNNSADEECDAEQSMEDMHMDNSDMMQRMIRHCEMMAMMMHMMMASDGTERDMQGMMGGAGAMGESTDEEMTMDGSMTMMMRMMMQMMMDGTTDEDGDVEPDMHGMDEGEK